MVAKTSAGRPCVELTRCQRNSHCLVEKVFGSRPANYIDYEQLLWMGHDGLPLIRSKMTKKNDGIDMGGPEGFVSGNGADWQIMNICCRSFAIGRLFMNVIDIDSVDVLNVARNSVFILRLGLSLGTVSC